MDFEAALGPVVGALHHRPAGLITDFDGTISPIVPAPEQARVTLHARRALRTLRGQLDLVAVVSGRAASDVRRRTGVSGIVYVGNHGLETWHRRRTRVHPDAEPWIPSIRLALQQAAERLGAREGLAFEDKETTAAIHYRNAPDRAAAREAILEAVGVAPAASQLRVEEGRMVVNLLPPVTRDKGAALRDLIAEHRLRGVVYLGDDVTDVHAFEALRALRATPGALVAVNVGVVGAETPEPIRALADVRLPDVESVSRLLARTAQSLGAP